MEGFTKDERQEIFQIIRSENSKLMASFTYVTYILPSLLFALYGTWKQDFLAVLVAYIALITVAVMYLQYSFDLGKHLRPAIKKYEDEVGALVKGAAE
jgi:hypothetical protein